VSSPPTTRLPRVFSPHFAHEDVVVSGGAVVVVVVVVTKLFSPSELGFLSSEAEVLGTEMGVLPVFAVADPVVVLPPDTAVVWLVADEAAEEVLKGIVIAVAPDDPLDGAPEVVGAEEAVVAADVVVADVVDDDDVSMEKVDVIIVIFTVMMVSLHQPHQNM